MQKSTYKYKELYFPRCLVCDTMLMLRTVLGKKKKVVTCPKCTMIYSRSMIKDANPERWNRVRERSLYELWTDSHGRLIMHHTGLGGRGH